MADLELTANNPAFTPVDLDAHDPLYDPELMRRVHEAMRKASEADWGLKNSESHMDWTPVGSKARIKTARRAAIAAWNAEQLAKTAAQ